MNGTGERKIEIFAPFGAAIDLTKLILFQPFDIAKWLTIGFAAFLSHLAGGGGGWFNPQLPGGGGDWKWDFRSTTHDALESTGTMPVWFIPLFAILTLIVLAIILVCLWIGARGKFIFTDCIVRNRGAIVEPWREFRREGNSYFGFLLILGLGMLLLVGVLSIPIWLPWIASEAFSPGPAFVLIAIGVGSVVAVLVIAMKVITSLMVPIMYRRRCGAFEALKAALGMIAAEPGPVILYVLFIIVLWIAFAMLSCVLTCVTCCVVAIPYVGTVILLPFHIFFASYLLLFVRQFGPDYDAWANVLAAAPVAAETTAPPVDAPPPSSEPPAGDPPPSPPPPVQT